MNPSSRRHYEVSASEDGSWNFRCELLPHPPLGGVWRFDVLYLSEAAAYAACRFAMANESVPLEELYERTVLHIGRDPNVAIKFRL